jgi:hypothetical protein
MYSQSKKPIDRTLINSWQYKRFVEAIRKTGRKQLVVAALWTDLLGDDRDSCSGRWL